jgi:hypothetical protein
LPGSERTESERGTRDIEGREKERERERKRESVRDERGR